MLLLNSGSIAEIRLGVTLYGKPGWPVAPNLRVEGNGSVNYMYSFYHGSFYDGGHEIFLYPDMRIVVEHLHHK